MVEGFGLMANKKYIFKIMFGVLGYEPLDFRPQEPAIGISGHVTSEFEVKNAKFLQ